MSRKNDLEDMVFNTIKGMRGLDRDLAWSISMFLVDIGMICDPIETDAEAALGQAEEKLSQIQQELDGYFGPRDAWGDILNKRDVLVRIRRILNG